MLYNVSMCVLFLRSLLKLRVALIVELKMKAAVTVTRWAMIFLMMMELMKESALKAIVQQRGSLKLAVRRYDNTGVLGGWARAWKEEHSWQGWPGFIRGVFHAIFPAVHHPAQQEKMEAFQSCCCSETGWALVCWGACRVIPLHHCTINFFLCVSFIY